MRRAPQAPSPRPAVRRRSRRLWPAARLPGAAARTPRCGARAPDDHRHRRHHRITCCGAAQGRGDALLQQLTTDVQSAGGGAVNLALPQMATDAQARRGRIQYLEADADLDAELV